MNLASPQFLTFLAAVVIVSSLTKGRSKSAVILFANLTFYALFDWRFLAALGLLICLNYICGRQMETAQTTTGRRTWYTLSVAATLGYLGYLKYFGFFSNSFAALMTATGLQASPLILHTVVPVGVSYYSFQMLTYTIDIYRRQIRPTKSLVTFAAFASFFPLITAGPIGRARLLIPQFEKGKSASIADVEFGLTRILFGFFKKTFIADTLAVYIVNPVFQNQTAYSTETLWLATAAYFVQIYADFSGYSSLAIGSARLLGLKVPENFLFPYLSRNIAEFWRRWHVSLSRWLRDYLWWGLAKSIPIDGNWWTRVKSLSALFTVFFICGLWHGASWTYIAWGALQGSYIVIYDIWQRWKPRIVSSNTGTSVPGTIAGVVLTQVAVGFSWLLFRADSVAGFLTSAGSLIQLRHGQSFTVPVIAWVAFAAFLIDHVAGYLSEHQPLLKEKISPKVKALAYAGMLLFLFHAQVEQASQFIYFQF